VISVHVVASTPALQAGLKSILDEAGFEVVRQAPANVILVDGAALQELLVAEGSEGVVLLTEDERQASELRSLGLSGWAVLPPDATPEQLAAAVHAVAHGLVAVAAGAAAELLPRGRVDVADQPAEPLPPRELEVLQLVSHGLSNKLIARQLSISEHTVKFHISSTYAKLGAASRTEAVSLAARRGLIRL